MYVLLRIKSIRILKWPEIANVTNMQRNGIL
jgi:hypothetical protein